MKKIIINYWPIFLLFLINLLFFSPVLKGKIPFPGDTLIGAYSPWRDLKWGGLSTEYPLKNMTVSDVTGSLYPWRYLAIEQIKQGKLPLWNNYEFSGTPLLANPYTAIFYPLNFLFFLFPFSTAWTILIILQPLLAGIFFYFFLRNKNLVKSACLFGALCFSYGSYFLLLTEFNMIGHTSLWFPLALLAIDKLFIKIKVFWLLILIISLAMPLLAGFVQFMIFGYFLVFLYAIYKSRFLKIFWLVIFSMIIAAGISAVQLVPFIELLGVSGRVTAYGDIGLFTSFFIPLTQLRMFLVPDYFGNPSTANYWGKVNYFEFCGYLGIISLVFIAFLIISKKIREESKFWLVLSLVSLFFAVNNPISYLPYALHLPFLSAFIPARLLFFTTFGFSVLAAFGLNYLGIMLSSNHRKQIIQPFLIAWGLLTGFILYWYKEALFGKIISRSEVQNPIILRNLFLPLLYLSLLILAFFLVIKLVKKNSNIIIAVSCLILIFDLSRQGRKFLTFFDQHLLYPEIETTKFLKENLGESRFMSLHQEIFGTNHQTMYGLESVEGFCAYYNNSYGTFVALGQGYTPTDGFLPRFERTVFGRAYQANVFKLLSVKYLLSFENINSADYPLVFQEGKVNIYENKKTLPRAFLSCDWEKNINPEKVVQQLSLLKNPAEKVFLDEEIKVKCVPNQDLGEVKITNYSSGEMKLISRTPESRILITGDIYYPGWKVYLDGKPDTIIRVDSALRGVVVPGGYHKIEFIYEPISFKIGLGITLGTILSLLGITSFVVIKRKW